MSLKILSAANSTAEVGETPVSIILQDDDSKSIKVHNKTRNMYHIDMAERA